MTMVKPTAPHHRAHWRPVSRGAVQYSDETHGPKSPSICYPTTTWFLLSQHNHFFSKSTSSADVLPGGKTVFLQTSYSPGQYSKPTI